MTFSAPTVALDLPCCSGDSQVEATDMCAIPAADDKHTDRRSPQDPGDLSTYIATLPDWNRRVDDDPVWMRPVTDYGLVKIPGTELAAAGAAVHANHLAGITVCEVDSDLIRYSAQDLVNISYIDAYIRDRTKLVDPEGWYGQDDCIVTPVRDGYAILDGTHRVVSDRLTGRPTRAFVIVTDPTPTT